MSIVVQNSWKLCGLFFVASFAGRCPTAIYAAEQHAGANRVEANRMFEFAFTSEKVYKDPFNEVELAAVFHTPQGKDLRVPAFWAGGQVWKVRYASAATGIHTFRTECNDTINGKLHGATGRVEVVPYTGDNPLFRHGPICVAADHRHFAHADAAPFFWLADTWWMGLCQRLHWPVEFQQLAADRKAKGFNVVQIVAGLYPDMPAFDPRGANEAGFPWEKDYARIRPEYFGKADQRLLYLVDQGFSPCIVGAWGYHLPWLGTDRMKKHWRYLIARYAALPVIWCAAGEGTMPYYASPRPGEDAVMQKQGWTEVIRSIRATDPFGRMITIHPSQSARETVTDPAVLDFDMHQTGHGPESISGQMAQQMQAAYDVQPAMPVIAGESSYDGLDMREWGAGVLSSAASRRMFWTGLMHNGAAGGTYGANGIWQVNRRGAPYGPSPHGRSWGSIPWDEAMNRAGSAQVGLAKNLLMQYEWWRFEPHDQWAAFADDSLALDGCQWIWYPEGNPAHDAPVEKRFFRRTFVLPEGKGIQRASLRISADDAFVVHLNGEILGGGDDWRIGKQFDITSRIKTGTNVLAIAAENKPAPVPANPAGLIACLEVHFANGEMQRLSSDADWRCGKAAAPGWDTAGFDDAAWAKALAVARYGDPPWGSLGTGRDNSLGPQAIGIAGGTRVIYVPQGGSISVRSLSPHAAYRALYFDPVTGKKTALGEVRADAAGAWKCLPPKECDHDWVIVLEAIL